MSEISLSLGHIAGNRPLPLAPAIVPEHGPSPAQWGIISFLVSEVALFSTLIVVYLASLGTNQTGPTPAVLSLRLVIGTTICLLASSVTIHIAVKALNSGEGSAFVKWWSATIALGIVFLAGTAYEWRELSAVHGLTISRNVFGSSYYTLVGFHAFHVTGGIVLMLTVLGLTLSRLMTAESRPGVELVSWYWHFVDGVWVVVFSVVYLVGR